MGAAKGRKGASNRGEEGGEVVNAFILAMNGAHLMMEEVSWGVGEGCVVKYEA